MEAGDGDQTRNLFVGNETLYQLKPISLEKNLTLFSFQ